MAAIHCLYPGAYCLLGQTGTLTKPLSRGSRHLFSRPFLSSVAFSNRVKLVSVPSPRLLARCAQPTGGDISSENTQLQDQTSPSPGLAGRVAESPSSAPNGPLLAGAAAMAGIALFLATRLSGGVPLSALEASATPLDVALVNGKPTVLEFYADWCAVCREMAPDVYALEKEYGGQINWVMLNIDNPKWDPELDEYRVDGIPHFVFLDSHAQAKAEMIGRLPRGILGQNTQALATGAESLPIQRYLGKTSALSDNADVIQNRASDPRSHG